MGSNRCLLSKNRLFLQRSYSGICGCECLKQTRAATRYARYDETANATSLTKGAWARAMASLCQLVLQRSTKESGHIIDVQQELNKRGKMR